MNRRNFLKNIGMGAAALVLSKETFGGKLFSNKSVSASIESVPNNKPNIIFIMADDLGYGDISCYGSTIISTPNLDTMATKGMKFTDYHSNGPVCSPTRAALMTGRYQQRCGIEDVIDVADKDKGIGLAQSETTFAEVLKQNGYSTALFGKWHLGYQTEFNPLVQGFDEFNGYVGGNIDYQSHLDQAVKGVFYDDWWQGMILKDETGYSTHLVTQHGLDFINRHKDMPFCLYLAHEAPHYPYQGPDDAALRIHGQQEKTLTAAQEKAAYKKVIESMDDGIGQIINHVKDLGLESKTFIIFCSDNGPVSPGSAGGLHGQKGTTWEGGHRVPCIAYWPGKIPDGVVSNQIVITMDWFATIAAVAGVQIPPNLNLDGINVLPVLTEGKTLPSRNLFWRYGSTKKAVRQDNWKLVKDPNTGTTLYDLTADLSEQTDLSVSNPAKKNELVSLLAAWEAQL